MKKNSKQRLFEVMSRLDKTFKPKLNESTDLDSYEDVVFMQGEDAEDALSILETQGEDAALNYLKQWHEPGSHMGSSELGHGSGDETYEKDGYIMSWNSRMGYIGLQYDLSHMNENIYKDDDPTSKAFRDLIKASDPEGHKRRWEKERPGEVEPEPEKPKAMNVMKDDLKERWGRKSYSTYGYKNDPRIITLRYDAVCDETGRLLKAGEEALYYPSSKDFFALDTKQAEEFRSWKADMDMGYDY